MRKRPFPVLDGESGAAKGPTQGAVPGSNRFRHKGSPPGSTSESAWGLEEAIGLPIDGLEDIRHITCLAGGRLDAPTQNQRASEVDQRQIVGSPTGIAGADGAEALESVFNNLSH